MQRLYTILMPRHMAAMNPAHAALVRRGCNDPAARLLTMNRLLATLLALLLAAPALAQEEATLPFTLEWEEVTPSDFPAMHSFAWAEHDGRWLVLTGRTDGMHSLFGAGFPQDFANHYVWVLDPESGAYWNADLAQLPDSVADPLRATNPQYLQRGDDLVIVGGYGWSHAEEMRLTFPVLTVVDVPAMMEAVIADAPLAPHLRQLEDARLAVTGGEMEVWDTATGRLALIMGHRFDGNYIPGGGADILQAYTEAVRLFDLDDDGTTLALANYIEVVNEQYFHRRDLNVTPAVLPGGERGLTVLGGVFRHDADLPFLQPVHLTPIDQGLAWSADDGFEQQMSQYTSPVLPLYDSRTGTQHTTLVGGLSLYYRDEAGTMIEDPLVPFVQEVTTISREAGGATTETIHEEELPALLGTNMIFAPADDLPETVEGVYDLRALPYGERAFVGWLYGGIEAERPNYGDSWASNRLFRIYVTPTQGVDAEDAPTLTTASLSMPQPNPFATDAVLTLTLPEAEHVRVEALDAVGRRVAVLHDGVLTPGDHRLVLEGDELPSGTYLVRAVGETFTEARRVVRVR